MVNRRKSSFILCVGFLLLSVNLAAQEEKYIGLFVYNFTKYFDWPESMKTGDFVIEVMGHQSVYDELLKITSGKKVGSQNIVLRSILSPDKIGKCHIMFVGHWQSRFLPDVITKIGTTPTLIISEMEGMLDKGSAINFVIREGNIKFEMSTVNVQKRQLKIDPRIRELALKVID